MTTYQRANGVVASHPLRMRKALGSNPSVSILPRRTPHAGAAAGVGQKLCARSAGRCGRGRMGGGLAGGGTCVGRTKRATALRRSSGAGRRRITGDRGHHSCRGTRSRMRCGRTLAAGLASIRPASLWPRVVCGWHPHGCGPHTHTRPTNTPLATPRARRCGGPPRRFRLAGARATRCVVLPRAWQAGPHTRGQAQAAHGHMV